jgi:glucose 1-dehydrogenase
MDSTLTPLAGKAALVTGASAGIGRATALALARAGADVAVNYLTYPQAAEELAGHVRALGRRCLRLPADVADQAAVEALTARAAAELGRLDVVVANAAHSDEAPFHTADLAGFRRTIDVTLWGAFYTLRAGANHMIRQGQGGNLVVIGSTHAEDAIPTSMAYNISKAAVEHMARTAAVELLLHRIRVNVVRPGWTDTPGERKYFTKEALGKAGAALPWGRLGRAEEVARAVLFVVDPASDYITGSTLSVDGGIRLPWWSRRGTGEL